MTDIKRYIENQARIVNDRLDILLNENMPSKVLDAMKHSVTNGGKRIRPILAVELNHPIYSKL